MKPTAPATSVIFAGPADGAAPVARNRQVSIDLRRTTRAVPGSRVLNEPTMTRYPSHDGTGTISVNVSVLTDPDGFVVERNPLMEELH